MTGFVIYSMGDPDFIRLALLGLSHAFEQGALSLAKIGLMLGLLAAFWQGVWNPGKIEFKQFFIGFFLVIIFFGKSVPVTLIHGDGVGADAMPPIPIGIALGGTIATNFGHAMADSLRQFYHTAYVPGSAATGSYRAMIGADGGGGQAVPVAGNGLQPFRELMKMRFDGNLDSFTSTSAYFAASNAAQGATGSAPAGGISKNISKSLENYLADCVLKDMYNQRNVQQVNEESMQTSPWAWGAMKVDYNGWATSINVDAGHGWKGVGCGSAYSAINGALVTEWKQIAEASGSTKAAINEALANYGQAMLGSTNAEAWKIKVNQVMMYHFKKAKTRSRWASQAELMASQAEFEALDKRRVSTGVQYSLWSEMAIPLMTYIESFVFLIGPLMPFIVAFGEKGAGMVLKYFFLLIWVNTWPILQVGVNMYLQNAINKASFGSMTYDAFSWSGFNTSFTEIESFIAMGSTLQTMVPALSLMLLYGSVHTAINMSNSAQKGGGSEGAMATPKAAGSADSGKLSVGNTNYAHDAHVGGMVNSYSGSNAAPIGMSQNNTKTDLSAATSNNIQAAKQRSEQASTASTKSITEMTNMMEVGSDGKSMQLTEGATRSQGMQRANAYADSLMKIEGMNAQDAKSLGLALSGGMGVKAQAEAAAALGFSAKAGKADAGGEVSSSGKFGVGVKGEVSAQATSKLDTAISNVASLAQQKGNNWSFSNTEQGSAVLASAEQLSTSNATGNTAGFGKSGQELEQSSKQWTDANSLVESESRNLSAIQGYSGGTSYNLAGVTSDAAQNRNDEKLADGSLLSTHARNTAFGSMNAEQKSDFDKFKKEGGYGKGLNGDIQALKDFSQTKEGASLAGMSSNFKTTQENAAAYEKAIAADVGGDKSLQARREATGRYADAAFKNIMGTFGSERFEASAKFLDQLNANAGGKMANWAAAADDFRSMGNKAEQPLSMPAPQTAEQAGGPTATTVGNGVTALKADAQNFVAAKGAAVTATNPNATHAANVQTVTQQNQADPNKTQEATDLGKKVDARLPKDGVVENLTQPLSDANLTAAGAIAPLGESVAGVASTLDNLVNGDAQERAAAQLAQEGNVSGNTAALMTGGGSPTAHSEIVDRMKNGLSENASPKEREAAIELMAASHAAGAQIESLRATGKAEDAKQADVMQQNVNSVNAALKESPFDDTQKEVLKGLGEKVANGDLSAKSANAGFEMMNNDKYDAAKTQHEASVATRGTSYRQLETNQLGGKAAMEVLESKGLKNSEEYKSLQQKTQDNQNVLDSNVKSRAVLDAQEAYRQVDGNHVHMTESRPIANAIISSSINGSDYKGLKDASMKDAMKGDSQDNSKSFLNYFKDSGDNIDAMKKYENVREGLVAASDQLRTDPKMDKYADRLDATIAKLDKQTGFDQRVAEPEPKPATSEAGGQGTTGATNGTPGTQSTTRSDTGSNDNGQGTVGVSPPASNQSTVTAQNTAASNGTSRTDTGSNDNGQGTGDNQTKPNQSTVTSQNTDSSNGTTRSEAGSNENNVQGNGGNQTTPSQSTVTAQNNVASNGTTNTGSNENGEGNGGENPPASNQSSVTTQNTDSNGTTRTESGANNVDSQSTGGNQTTSSQSTVTAQNNVASNGTTNTGSNDNGQGTGDNQTTPSEGAATKQNADSNVTTRTESGANNVDSQSTAGNQTTSSQSTVTAQNNVASNGTTNTGSNDNGQGTGDNQTTPSEGAVTAQNTDSNGTTRTEAGSNENNVQGTGGVNQGSSNQDTVAPQNNAVSNGSTGSDGGSNTDGQGTGSDNPTTSSQSTVATQSNVASNGSTSTDGGSNTDGQGTGSDNPTTSDQSTVTAQNTDSSNGSTRTEAGSNETNVQGTGGENQTTSSQSTVATQSNVASNGSTSTDAGSNTTDGQGAGENQTTTSEATVTTQSTDTFNGSTRTDAGTNEVTGNVSQSSAEQSTSASTGSENAKGNPTGSSENNDQGSASTNAPGTSNANSEGTLNNDSGNSVARGDTGTNNVSNANNPSNPPETVAKGDNSKPGNEENNEPAAEGKASSEVGPSSESVQSDPVTRSETGSNANAGSEDTQSSESAGSGSTGDNTKPMTPDSQRVPGEDGDRIKVSNEGFEQIQSAPEGAQMELGGESFTKVGGGENNGVQTSQLMNNESGEHHNLYQNTNTGGGNLSIESFGGHSRV